MVNRLVYLLSTDGENVFADEDGVILFFDTPTQAEEWCKENGYDYDELLLISAEVVSDKPFFENLDDDDDLDYFEGKVKKFIEGDN